MTSEIRIRIAGQKDAESICTIGEKSFSRPWLLETIRDDMDTGRSMYFAAEEENRVIGYACYWFVLDEAQLVNIAVLSGKRLRGAGALLMEAGIEEAGRRGMAAMFLEVRAGNTAAQNLYRRYGFTVTALRHGLYDKPPEDGYIMTRRMKKKT